MTIKLKSSFRLALACIGFTSAANAATTAYNAGDLFLNFRGGGAASSLIVNLGPNTAYKTPGPAFTVGNLGADLTTTFGAAWTNNNSTNLKWGVSGTSSHLPDDGTPTNTLGDPGRTLYLSKSVSPSASPTTPWNRFLETSGGQGSVPPKINNYAQAFSNKATSTVYTNALIQPNSATNNYNGQIGTGTNSFAAYNTTEGTFGNGAANTALDLFRMVPDTANNGNPGDYLGRFTIDSAGLVTFTPVPEAGSASLLLGTLGLLAFRRRRSS